MDPFLGEIRIFGGIFAPKDWHFCDGALLPISQYSALFSLLGTSFGGNGTSNFALPKLGDRVPLFWGTGPGLTQRVPGETGGTALVTIDMNTMAQHTHVPRAFTGAGTLESPQNATWATSSTRDKQFSPPPSDNKYVNMAAAALDPQGGGLPHPNVQPFIVVNYIIALAGIFPQRP